MRPGGAAASGGTRVAAVAAGWLAARAGLDRLATLRADVAEALHHVRVALDPPSG